MFLSKSISQPFMYFFRSAFSGWHSSKNNVVVDQINQIISSNVFVHVCVFLRPCIHWTIVFNGFIRELTVLFTPRNKFQPYVSTWFIINITRHFEENIARNKAPYFISTLSAKICRFLYFEGLYTYWLYLDDRRSWW